MISQSVNPTRYGSLIEDVIGPIRLPLECQGNVAFFQLTYFETKHGRWIVASLGEVSNCAAVLLRIESACTFGHIFGSRQCDCGYQLDHAFRAIIKEGRGMVVFGVDQDARGLGLRKHFEIYTHRQRGALDTKAIYDLFEAPLDNREYAVVGEMLGYLTVNSVVLMTNNPARLKSLADMGFTVERRPLEAPLDTYNMATLMLEKEDLGYSWSFLTHGHWLRKVQLPVIGDIDRRCGMIVADNAREIAHWCGDGWDVALHLMSRIQVKNQSDLIVYLSDLPRLDEITIYADLGAAFIVVPFANLPPLLIERASQLGVKLQDWERDNRYPEIRPQWLPVTHTAISDWYRRSSERREFRL